MLSIGDELSLSASNCIEMINFDTLEIFVCLYIQFVEMTRHVCLCWTKKTEFFILNVGAIHDGEMLSKGDGLSLPA